MTPETEKICLPKQVKKHDGYGDDSKLWSNSIKSNFNRVQADTLKRMKNIAYNKMYSLLQDPGFLALLRAKEMNQNAVLKYVGESITAVEAYYMHAESWKAVSFPFGQSHSL
jgi:hypothetical protein